MSQRAFLSLAVFLSLVILLSARAADEKKADPKKPGDNLTVARLSDFKLDNAPLSEALALVTLKTGILVEDRRQNKEDVKISLDLKKATFWQIMDSIAKEADARLNLVDKDDIVSIVDGPFRAFPVSYNGIFRTTVTGLVATKDLETDASYTDITMEIAWEPGFRAFFMEPKLSTFVIEDDKKNKLDVPDEASGRLQVTGRLRTREELRFASAPRPATKLSKFKGEIVVTGPSKWLTFNFPTLADMKKDPKLREQEQEGVKVKVAQMDLGKDLWALEMALEYPANGPKFESFESWLVYNDIHLTRAKGEGRMPHQGYSTGNSGANKGSIEYNFIDTKEHKRGDPADWKVEYKAAGTFVEIPLTFEFTDLPLP